ncbi:MAG: cell division protein ZapA [Alcaligenaceae bacterium]|nr:cell division protein ZapA [Alcaligenaceae bacterium]
MERVSVSILGREFSLACASEERQKLVDAVKHADQLMLKIKGAGNASVSNERIAIMACIQMASDLLSVKAIDGPFAGVQYGDFKQKIEELNLLLDEGINDLKGL